MDEEDEGKYQVRVDFMPLEKPWGCKEANSDDDICTDVSATVDVDVRDVVAFQDSALMLKYRVDGGSEECVVDNSDDDDGGAADDVE